jgi:hypothetical protein
MKSFLTISIVLIWWSGTAQTPYKTINDIPLPAISLQEDNRIALTMPFREELWSDFSDKSKIGERFKGMVRKNYTNKLFGFQGDASRLEIQTQAYEFYKKRLNPRIFLPNDSPNKKDVDISKLKDGEASEVVFYASWWGGGVFLWYIYKNEELTRLSITVGQSIALIEQVYSLDVPVIEPSENELQFPKYPGSKFMPLESSYITGFEDFPTKMNILFVTPDSPEKVIAFFESLPRPEDSFRTRPKENMFSKEVKGLDWSSWPRLSILHEPERTSQIDGKTKLIPAHTQIVYSYPVEERGN